MLTRNGKCLFTNSIDSDGKPYDRTFLLTNGTTKGTGSMGFGTGKNIMRIVGAMSLAVGTGTTPPTANDYTLETPDSSLSSISSSSSGNRSSISYTDNYMYTCSRTYKNNTSNPITITEVGLQADMPSYSSGSFGTILLAREVLETPITIEPTKTYTFSITLE